MEYEIHKPLVVEDGKYNGVIIDIEYRTEPYKYTDVVVEFNKGARLKYSCSSYVSTTSKLGKLLNKFGVQMNEGEMVDDKKVLIGKTCTFMVMNDEKDEKKYPRIVEGSLKPL